MEFDHSDAELVDDTHRMHLPGIAMVTLQQLAETDHSTESVVACRNGETIDSDVVVLGMLVDRPQQRFAGRGIIQRHDEAKQVVG